jgi:S-formylglutathione hydrolase FrmB
MTTVSRRAALLGGLAGAAALVGGGGLAVEEGLLPGRHGLHRLLGMDGPAGSIPDVQPGRTISGSFTSAARLGATTGWTIAYPPHAAAPLRVLIHLHGRGGDHKEAFGSHLGLDRFLAQAVRRGSAPFAIASVDGGDHSYWHRRADGSDSGAMVVDEFIPLLAARGLDTSRIGLHGLSMGGYGALWLSTRLGASRVAAIVAESPAIWHSAGDTPSGAFDSAADFAAHSIFGRTQQLAGIAVRIDCGSSDGFAAVTRDLRAALTPRPAGGLEPGDHDMAYWRRMAPAQLDFVAAHLPR